MSSYDELAAPKTYSIVDAVVAYYDHRTGETAMLQINQAIFVPQMTHNLLCPMQLRMSRVMLNEEPKFLAKNPSMETHAISVKDEVDGSTFVIPLSLKGVTSYFPSRKPTLAEYQSSERIYALTQEEPEWEPSSTAFCQQEEAATNEHGDVVEERQ